MFSNLLEIIKKFFSSPKKILFVILIIAAFLRLYNITLLPPGLYPDEAMNGTNIQEALSPNGHFKVFYPENNGREGLFMAIQAIFVAAFGNQPWALRLASTLFGIFTVLGVYLLTKELFYSAPDKPDQPLSKPGLKTREKIALLASFFIATSFWHINFSRIGFRAIMAPFFLTWTIYLLLRTFRSLTEQTSAADNPSLATFQLEKTFKQPKIWWGFETKTLILAIISGAVFGLGFYSYLAYRATPLIIFILFAYWIFVYKEWKKELAKFFLIGVATALIVFAPLGYYFVKHPADFMGRTGQVSVFKSQTPIKDLAVNTFETAAMFNFIGDGNQRHNVSGRPEIFWPVGILFLISIYLAIKTLIKNGFFKKQDEVPFGSSPIPEFKIKSQDYTLPFLIMISWLVVAALPVVVSNEGIPHALRSILMIPPIFILAGFAGVWLYDNYIIKFKNASPVKNKIVIAFLVLFFILLPAEAYYTYFNTWGNNPNTLDAFTQNYVDLGNEINSLPNDLPKYIIVDAGGVEVRGIPMPAMTVMFITDTFTPEKQKEKNIHYILPNQMDQITPGSYTNTIN